MIRKLFALSATMLLLGAASPSVEQPCGLPGSFRQADRLRSERTVRFDPDVLVFSSPMHVDADGGPHTYSLVDPDGTLCNPRLHPENRGRDPATLGCAMDTICVGATVTTPDGRTLDHHSCGPMVDAFRRLRAGRWVAPAGYALNPVGIEMVRGHPHIPCVAGDYLVSTSSTPSGVGGAPCRQARWLDTAIPSIVVPKCWSNDYRRDHPRTCATLPQTGIVPDVGPGDLVAVIGRSSRTPIFGVVGDLGSNAALGEASVGLLMQAAGMRAPPTYLAQTNSLDQRERFDVVIFKHSRYRGQLTLANVAGMTAAGREAFLRWGGDADRAAARLAACGHLVAPAS